MLGVSTQKGQFIVNITGMIYLISLLLVKADRVAIASVLAGAAAILLTIYFKLVKKELCGFVGIPTWVIGILFIGLGVMSFIA